MTTLYESTGNELDRIGYTTITGYTMHREDNGSGAVPWVLRDPNGEVVDTDSYRLRLALRNGFELGAD